MLVSDKWNPRLRLRDWLNKPSQVELAEAEAPLNVGAAALLEERATRAAADAALVGQIRAMAECRSRRNWIDVEK